MTIEKAIEVIDGRYLRMSMVADYEECRENNEAISMAIAALRAQQEAENAKLNENPCKAMQWISVKDRLPDLDENFIFDNRTVISFCGGYVMPIIYEKTVEGTADGRGKSAYIWRMIREGEIFDHPEMITHWMPLPEAPDTDKK